MPNHIVLPLEMGSRGFTKCRAGKLGGVLLAAGLASCSQSDFSRYDDDAGAVDDDRPGDSGWREQDVSCDADSDCIDGESCIEGVCQMSRCKDGPYVSDAPLGALAYFARNHELVIADAQAHEGKYWVDGYDAPGGSEIDYPGSWDAGSSAVRDVAGGNLLGKRPDTFAVAVEGSSRIRLGGGDDSIDVEFHPEALAAGDVDGDGVDELVALSKSGEIAVCHLDEAPRRCQKASLSNAEGVDVTVADITGDGLGEIVFLLEAGGESYFYVWSTAPGEEIAEGKEDYGHYVGTRIHRIDAGDIDGDGVAEVVAFQDDAWGFWNNASLFIYRAQGDELKQSGQHQIHDSTMDVTVADLDHDRVDEIITVRSNGEVEVLRATSPSSLQMQFATKLQVSVSPHRIDASDFNGNSPGGKLVSGPSLFAGDVVPTIAAHFPPHDLERSDGDPTLFLGNSEITSTTATDTVTLSLGFDVGVNASFLDIFKAGVSVSLREQLSKSRSVQKTLTVGDRYMARPDVQRHGTQYGMVALSVGCFHAYTYEVEDPAELLGEGSNDGRIQVLVPVGGATTFWSTTRYNAMAERVQGLPHIEIPHVVGDPSSYASEPVRSDGSPIPEEDLVFPEVPRYVVSDAGSVGWWLAVSDTVTNEVARSTSLSIDTKAGIGPFEFGTHLGAGWGHSYAVSIGHETLFGGSVPPIPNDPTTPEDEYAAYAYAFSPVVYRERYTDAGGNDAAFYVLSFLVDDVK
jgi:hypothetical protein